MVIVTITIDGPEVEFQVMDTGKGQSPANLLDLARAAHTVEGRLLGMLSLVPQKPEEKGHREDSGKVQDSGGN